MRNEARQKLLQEIWDYLLSPVDDRVRTGEEQAEQVESTPRTEQRTAQGR